MEKAEYFNINSMGLEDVHLIYLIPFLKRTKGMKLLDIGGNSFTDEALLYTVPFLAK